jgi:curved DNA-binding protein CbpA
MNLNFYKILHCQVNDSQLIIKKNYYKLCKKYHPDRIKNNPDNGSKEHIKKINLAYEVLGDLDKRKNYNKYILKKEKSKIDYLNMLFIIYNTVYNDTLKIMLENAIIQYLNIYQTITIKFFDFYNGSKQKINLFVKNYNTNKDEEISLLFELDKQKNRFKNKGDLFHFFKGDIIININIDYGIYNQFQIMNDRLFYLVNNSSKIELPTGDILDITNIKWNHSKYGYISTIANYGLLKNKNRNFLTLCKNSQ